MVVENNLAQILAEMGDQAAVVLEEQMIKELDLQLKAHNLAIAELMVLDLMEVLVLVHLIIILVVAVELVLLDKLQMLQVLIFLEMVEQEKIILLFLEQL